MRVRTGGRLDLWPRKLMHQGFLSKATAPAMGGGSARAFGISGQPPLISWWPQTHWYLQSSRTQRILECVVWHQHTSCRIRPSTMLTPVQIRQQHLRVMMKMKETWLLALNGNSPAHERDPLEFRTWGGKPYSSLQQEATTEDVHPSATFRLRTGYLWVGNEMGQVARKVRVMSCKPHSAHSTNQMTPAPVHTFHHWAPGWFHKTTCLPKIIWR